MIYICADDYGFILESDKHIRECINEGAVNKVSVFPSPEIEIPKNVLAGVHINLVEGKATNKNMCLITDENGNFKYSFIGLLLKSFLPGRKKLEKEIYLEISSQIELFKKNLQDDAPFCIDTHQHTHMIPLVFNTLLKVIKNEKHNVCYMRIPTEPILPYIKSVSIWKTYRVPNILKQFILNFLWFFSKRKFKECNIKSAAFMGIMFSGKMDTARILKVLPHYIKLADKKNIDIELLFHPGYIENAVETKFKKFYQSDGRKTEYVSAMTLNISDEGSVLNGLR